MYVCMYVCMYPCIKIKGLNTLVSQRLFTDQLEKLTKQKFTNNYTWIDDGWDIAK